MFENPNTNKRVTFQYFHDHKTNTNAIYISSIINLLKSGRDNVPLNDSQQIDFYNHTIKYFDNLDKQILGDKILEQLNLDVKDPNEKII